MRYVVMYKVIKNGFQSYSVKTSILLSNAIDADHQKKGHFPSPFFF